MTPSSLFSGATPLATLGAAGLSTVPSTVLSDVSCNVLSFTGARTMGRALDVSSRSASGESSINARATSRSLAMSANGFSFRNFRSRKAATAAAFEASQARW